MKTKSNLHHRTVGAIDTHVRHLGRIHLPKVLLVAAMALLASAGSAWAEDYRGEFTLPSPTQWGSAVLPAGTYSFTMNPEKAPYMLKLQRGLETAVFIAPAGKTPLKRATGASSLTAIRRGGKLRIQSLFLANEGVVFDFNLPKGEASVVAEKPELIQRIPVLLAKR